MMRGSASHPSLTVAGHSADGHLALWRGVSGLGDGVGPVPRTYTLAPVANLIRGAVEGIGDGAEIDFVGGTQEELPEAYARRSGAAVG